MSVPSRFAAETISHGLYVLGELTNLAIRHHTSVGQRVTEARLIALRSDLARYRFIAMDGFYEKDVPRVIDDLAQDLASLQRKGLDLYRLMRPVLPEGIEPISTHSFADLAPFPIGAWDIQITGKLNALPLLTCCAASGYKAGAIRLFPAKALERDCLYDIVMLHWRMYQHRELITTLAEFERLRKALKKAEQLGIFPTVLIAGAFSKSVEAQHRRCVEIDYSDAVDCRYRLKRIR